MRNSWGVLAAEERKQLNSSRKTVFKTEKGLENADDRGGRQMLRIDIWERESWRVIEYDSKEKAGRQDGSCVKGSRMRKPVPPPFEELVPE